MWVLKAAIVSGLLLPPTLANRLYLPPVYHNGSVEVENFSVPGNLDGFKMKTPANTTSFDFWYFDAFSRNTSAAINIVFFNTGDFAANPHPLTVQISGTFDNGTQFSGEALAFYGTNLEKPNVEYVVKLNSPSIGVRGTFKLKSRAPPHYPCNPNVDGLNTLLLPHLHWSNAVPDAQANIDLTINGTEFKVTDGVGYHDKNWGDASVITSPKYWDWGHASLGPYSLVWYDLLDYNNTEHAVEVRQWGANATYPPTSGIATNEGLTARFDLGGGQAFVANLTKEVIIHDQIVYARALGSVTGGIEGQEQYQGRGAYEEYVYGLLYGKS
ncbi:hydroxyneurosporene synthase [Aspergillus oryzae]|uniref:Hydroxyneurosporene synthase n=1 Tax=Aspergillus oryzae TaxID=5062 RepID=A0A1S9DXE9_ASPOZ|nr:hydroxyneurosporene synthase [Aspergillus oryzae]